MANTISKVNSFISLGYVFLAEEASKAKPIESSPEESSLENENIVQNTEEQENILPINNQVIKTVNINTNYSGLRI